jgi:MFS family permease
VLGMSASGAGMILLLLSLGWTAGSLIAGHGIDRLGYRSVAAVGMASMAVGFGIFVMTGEPVALFLVLLASLLIGVGMGMANLTTLVSAQSAVPIRRIGVATSTLMLFRTFGGAFCISLMGTVLLNHMQQGLERVGGGLSATVRDKIANPQNLLEPATRASIPPEYLPQLIDLLADSIWYAFLTAFLLMIIGCAVSAGMGSYTPANTPRPDGKPSQ